MVVVLVFGEWCCILNVGRDEGDKGFEVVFNVFGEVVGGAVTARNDWATRDIKFE